MEAGFLGAAAAPEPQVRPDSPAQKRARAVFTPPPAVGGRADSFGVGSEHFLRAAAATRHSESSGPGHGATIRARTLAARSARPPQPSRAPLPTPSRARSSLSCGQTTRVHDMALEAQHGAVRYSYALRTMRACAGRHAKIICDACSNGCTHICAVFVPRASVHERGWRR